MSKTLHVGPGVSIPLDFVTRAHAIIARRRRGKSYTASVIAEEMLQHHQQIGVIDPTGAWFGLKSSADGKEPGYAVVVFGGDHKDAPLDWRAGRQMAQAFIQQGFSAIFDVSNMDTEEQISFVNDFAREMLKTNRDAVHLFIDEADTFAPQLLEGKLQKVCLGSMSRLVKQGGIRGIGITLITQRSADLNKKLLSQVEAMTALTLSHPPDIAPVADWISANIGKEEAAKAAAIMPTLPVGVALFCIPGEGVKKVAVRTRRTFNSGATPKPGERRVEPKVLASVDIDKLGKDIAASVQEARENSVEVLKEKIRTLETKLAKGVPDVGFLEEAQKTHEQLSALTLENHQLRDDKDAAAARAGIALSALAHIGTVIEEARRRIEDPNAKTIDPPAFPAVSPTRTPIHPPQPAPVALRPVSAPSPAPKSPISIAAPDGSKLPPVCVRILEALARLRSINMHKPRRLFVCLLSGYSNLTSSGFVKAMGVLSVAGFVEYNDGTVSLTSAGIAAAPHVSRPVTQAEFDEIIFSTISPKAGSMLTPLIEVYPESLLRDEVMKAGGYTNLTSSGFVKALGELSTKGFVEYGKGTIRASEMCFIDGAR
jgi:hypothetical protein